MKKVFTMIAVAAVATAFVACGPSKEELEKREQFKQDSIASVEKQRQDSLAQAMQAEQMKAEREKAMQDSTRMADSVAAAANAKGGHKKH